MTAGFTASAWHCVRRLGDESNFLQVERHPPGAVPVASCVEQKGMQQLDFILLWPRGPAPECCEAAVTLPPWHAPRHNRLPVAGGLGLPVVPFYAVSCYGHWQLKDSESLHGTTAKGTTTRSHEPTPPREHL